MKQFIILMLLSFCCGCNWSQEVSDAELKAIMSHPRYLERFQYIGSNYEYDYFVGEQWRANSYPPAARRSELYYKVRSLKPSRQTLSPHKGNIAMADPEA